MGARLTRWTDERVKQLKQLWHDGYSSAQIAAEFRTVSRSAVIGKISRLGLGRDPDHNMKTIKVRERMSRQAPQMRRRETTKKSEPIALPRMSQAKAALRRPMPEARKIKFPATLFDLGPHSCRWPVGEPSKPGFFFCGADGADIAHRRPYCGGARCRVFRDTNGRKWKTEVDHGDVVQWIRQSAAD